MNNDLGRVLRVNSSLSDGYDTDRTNGSGCDPTKPRKGDGRFERRRGAVARFAAALALTTCMSLPLTAAWAEEAPRTDGIPDPSIATSLPPALGTTFGLRPWLAAYGITYQLNQISEGWRNSQGGEKLGNTYVGRTELVIDADLEKLLGWKGGSAHANGFWIQGHGLSGYYVGNLLAVSNIEALPTVRLFEAWFEQKLFNDTTSIRLGQLAADSEFITSDYAGMFINGTFGWPGITAADLPSGGPAYPLATPAVRLKIDPTPNHSFLIAVFNGDPAGPGLADQDPQLRNKYGTNFRVQDPPFVIGEAQFKYTAVSGLPGTLKFGGWHHFASFEDQRYGSDGRLLADEDNSNGVPVTRKSNNGLYAVIDQKLLQLEGGEADKGVGMFARVSASPSDRNLIDLYVDAGLNFKGIVPYRPEDAFGVAFGYARISSRARAFDQDVAFLATLPQEPEGLPGLAPPVRDYEAVLELTYQAQIVPGWTIQPDFQYIFHPGGHVADPADPDGLRPLRNAAVLGVRTTIRY
jgi:porin